MTEVERQETETTTPDETVTEVSTTLTTEEGTEYGQSQTVREPAPDDESDAA